MMKVSSALVAVLGAVSTAHAQDTTTASPKLQTPTTWFSTSFITEKFTTSRTVLWGPSPVTPVPTTTLPIIIQRTTLTLAAVSRNINLTTWAGTTVKVTLPLTTALSLVSTTVPRPTVTADLTTAVVWTSPNLATVTLTATPTACISGTNPSLTKTVTKYTGTYSPFPGQITNSTVPTKFATSVVTQFYDAVTYHLTPFTGTTTAVTYTATSTSYLSTLTSTSTVTYFSPPADVRYTPMTYLSTTTRTSTDFRLAYATTTLACPSGGDGAGPTATKTQHAKCAPTNLISARDGRGVEVRNLTPGRWTYPLGFSGGVLSGIPAGGAGDNKTGVTIPDPSACCQLCVDNKGCAASEWVTPRYGGPASCLLYWFGGGDSADKKRDSCGRREGEDAIALEYIGNVYDLPGQGSIIQEGCGMVKYIGATDPVCPSCGIWEWPRD